MKNRLGTWLLVGAGIVALGLMAAGCTETEQGAGVGAGLGAGLGAIIGNQSGHSGEGAVIGAAAGAIGGGMVGNAREKQHAAQAGASQRVMNCPQCGGDVDVTGIPSGTQVRCPRCNAAFPVS